MSRVTWKLTFMSVLFCSDQEFPFLSEGTEVQCWESLLSLTIHLLQKYHSESKGTDQVAETQAQIDELKGIMVRNIGIWLPSVPRMQGSSGPEWQSCRESYWVKLTVGWPLLTEWTDEERAGGSSEFASCYLCWAWLRVADGCEERCLRWTWTARGRGEAHSGFGPFVTVAFLQLLWGKCSSVACFLCVCVRLWFGFWQVWPS